MKGRSLQSIGLTSLSLGASAMGFVAQLLLAKVFGISASVDAYFFSLGAPMVAGGLVSSAINFHLTPQLRLSYTVGGMLSPAPVSESAVFRLAWRISILTVAVGVLALPLQWWGLPTGSAILMEPQLPLLMIGGWLFAGSLVYQSTAAALLTSRDRLMQAAILPLFPPTASAVLLLIAGEKLGIGAVLGGQLAGSIAAVVFSHIALLGVRVPVPRVSPPATLFREVFRGLPFAGIAIACFTFYPLLDSVLAPHAGAGVMSQIAYAQRIVIGLGTLLAAAPLATLANEFSDISRTGSLPGFVRKVRQSVALTFGMATLLGVVFMTEGHTVVALLFGRGKFSTEDIEAVGSAIRWMAPGMVLMLLSSLIYRAGFALTGGARALAPVGLVWVVSYSVLGAALLRYGVVGLAIAYSITWLFAFATTVLVIYRCAKRHFRVFA
jgi:putative peptidoglycan lipid II flippase